MKLILALALLGAATTAYAQRDQTRTDNYCAGLTALSTDLGQLQALRSDANPGDLRAIADRVDKDVRLIEQDISSRATAEAKQFMASAESLLVKARAVPEGMTMDQVKARMQDDLKNLQDASSKLQASCKPAPSEGSAMPQPAQGEPQQPPEGANRPPR